MRGALEGLPQVTSVRFLPDGDRFAVEYWPVDGAPAGVGDAAVVALLQRMCAAVEAVVLAPGLRQTLERLSTGKQDKD